MVNGRNIAILQFSRSRNMVGYRGHYMHDGKVSDMYMYIILYKVHNVYQIITMLRRSHKW